MTAEKSKYKLTILMSVLNEEQHLAYTLDQLYLQDFPKYSLEVMIIDGGSTDKTKEIAENYRKQFGSFKILDNPGKLAASGRNIGIKNSTAPYLLVLDGHSHIPSKSFLGDIIKVFEETEADCLCQPQPLNPPNIDEYEQAVALCRSSALGHNPTSDIYSQREGFIDPTSSGAMYKREVFDKIGMYDEELSACEDVELNYRIKLAGLKAYLSPKLTVFYYPRSTLKGLWNQMNRYGMGRYKYSRKHNLFSPIRWLAPVGVLGFVIMILLSLVSTPVFDVFKTLLGFYLLIVLLFSLFLSVREKTPSCLLYGLLIFPAIHFGLGVGFLKALLKNMIQKGKLIFNF